MAETEKKPKMKTVTLQAWQRAAPFHPETNPQGRVMVNMYRVESATNTTDFTPWQELSKAEVDALCERDDFTVKLVQFKQLK